MYPLLSDNARKVLFAFIDSDLNKMDFGFFPSRLQLIQQRVHQCNGSIFNFKTIMLQLEWIGAFINFRQAYKAYSDISMFISPFIIKADLRHHLLRLKWCFNNGEMVLYRKIIDSYTSLFKMCLTYECLVLNGHLVSRFERTLGNTINARLQAWMLDHWEWDDLLHVLA